MEGAARVSKCPPSSSGSAPIKKKQQQNGTESVRVPEITLISPWPTSARTDVENVATSQGAELGSHLNQAVILLLYVFFFLACKWGTYKKQKVTLHHSVLPSDFLIWAKVRPTAPPRLRVSPEKGHQPPLCPAPLWVLSRCSIPALSHITWLRILPRHQLTIPCKNKTASHHIVADPQQQQQNDRLWSDHLFQHWWGPRFRFCPL